MHIYLWSALRIRAKEQNYKAKWARGYLPRTAYCRNYIGSSVSITHGTLPIQSNCTTGFRPKALGIKSCLLLKDHAKSNSSGTCLYINNSSDGGFSLIVPIK